MNYYTDHDLIPVYPGYELQLSRTVKIFQAISFQEIAKQTGVEVSILEKLNPSYKKKLHSSQRKRTLFDFARISNDASKTKFL